MHSLTNSTDDLTTYQKNGYPTLHIYHFAELIKGSRHCDNPDCEEVMNVGDKCIFASWSAIDTLRGETGEIEETIYCCAECCNEDLGANI